MRSFKGAPIKASPSALPRFVGITSSRPPCLIVATLGARDVDRREADHRLADNASRRSVFFGKHDGNAARAASRLDGVYVVSIDLAVVERDARLLRRTCDALDANAGILAVLNLESVRSARGCDYEPDGGERLYEASSLRFTWRHAVILNQFQGDHTLFPR
jgi:hypothetical protein